MPYLARIAFLTALLCMAASASAQANLPPLPNMASEPPTEQTSYEHRILRRSGVRDADPNVYVYTADFAKRFQMPEAWVSNELKGVDAVAFRVVPYPYATCGWGGNPKACRRDEVRCEMDLYFDHQRNPLPWDERMPPVQLNRHTTSADFITSSANRLALPESRRRHMPRSPFTDPKTGKELLWEDRKTGGGGGWLTILSYHRELYSGISLVTMKASCLTSPAYVWLSSDSLDATEGRDSSGNKVLNYREWSAQRGWFPLESLTLNKLVEFPSTWQESVSISLQEAQERNNIFYRQQLEKVLNSSKTQ